MNILRPKHFLELILHSYEKTDADFSKRKTFITSITTTTITTTKNNNNTTICLIICYPYVETLLLN